MNIYFSLTGAIFEGYDYLIAQKKFKVIKKRNERRKYLIEQLPKEFN